MVTGTEELKENIYNQKGDKINMCKAVDNALKERESLGRQVGLQQGLEQGIQQGLQQGRDKATVNSIQNLTKNLGINISEAMKLLGLSEQDQERYLMLL